MDIDHVFQTIVLSSTRLLSMIIKSTNILDRTSVIRNMRLVSRNFLKMMNEYMLKNCMINVCDMMYYGTSTYTFNVKNITKVRLSCLTSIEYESNKDILVEFLRSMKSVNHIEVVYNFQNISILKYFDENTIDILRIHSDIIPKSGEFRFYKFKKFIHAHCRFYNIFPHIINVNHCILYLFEYTFIIISIFCKCCKIY